MTMKTDSKFLLWLVAGILTVAFLPGVIGQSEGLYILVAPSRPGAFAGDGDPVDPAANHDHVKALVLQGWSLQRCSLQ